MSRVLRFMSRPLCQFLLGLIVCRCARADMGVATAYEVRYGPLTILSVSATTQLSTTTYRSTAEMRTVGMAAYLFPWQSRTSTEGRRDNDRFEPQKHRTSGTYRGEPRRVEIDYAAHGRSVTKTQPPASSDYRNDVPPALQQSTIDPMTATLQALYSQCRGTLPIFDGRRRYDVVMVDAGQADVPPARGAVYAGPARHCRAEVKPLAGFWRPDSLQDERPSRLEYWIAAPRADLPPVPVYMELSSARGTLKIHLTGLQRIGAPGNGDAANNQVSDSGATSTSTLR